MLVRKKKYHLENVVSQLKADGEELVPGNMTGLLNGSLVGDENSHKVGLPVRPEGVNLCQMFGL